MRLDHGKIEAVPSALLENGEQVHLKRMASRLKLFLAELRRRKVTRAAAAYLVIGFAVIEGADNLQGPLGIPEGVMVALAILFIAGFPVALALAWAFDLTSKGIEKTQELSEDTNLSPWERGSGLRRPAFAGPLLVVILAMVTAVLVWAKLQPASVQARGTLYVDSVAVMPLANLTGSQDMDFLSMALAEEIISELSQIRELKVTSRHSVEVLSRQAYTIPQLADTLRVRHMVEGSIRLLPDSTIRATVQHIDASTDAHLWAQTFDWDARDLAGLYEGVAEEVTRRVIGEIPGVSMPPDLGEYRGETGLGAYQMGKYWLGRRTPEGLRRAIVQFRLALQDDPDHALALADLSSAYALALNYRYQVGEDEWAMAATALAAAEEAIRLAPEMAGGYASRGYLRAIVHAPVDRVREDLERAASLQPNAASIPSWSARLLAMEGRNEEAVSEARRAVDLDPFAAGRHVAVASLAVHLGRFDEAIRAGSTATELEPELAMGRALVARAHLLRGDPALCVAMDLGPHAVTRATCLQALGDTIEARQIVDSVQAELDGAPRSGSAFTDILRMEDLAVFYAWNGDAARTLAWMGRAFQESPAGFERRLYESALFDRIRSQPGFSDAAGRLFQGRYEEVRRRSRRVVLP